MCGVYFCHIGQYLDGSVVISLTRFGQAGFACCPVEQLNPQPYLQIHKAATDGRFDDAELICSPTYASSINYVDKAVHIFQLAHDNCSYNSNNEFLILLFTHIKATIKLCLNRIFER